METKLGFLDSPNKVVSPLFAELEKVGIKVSSNNNKCDWLWNASVLHYASAKRVKKQFPNARLVNYVWDFYKWAWEGKREQEIYDWRGYGEFLKESDLVLCPNEGTKKRIKEYTGVSAKVVHTAIACEDNSTPDQGYVLNPLREYPEPNLGWTERACKELDIPYLWSNHQYALDEWKNVVAGARLMVSEYTEASTGGLSLIEGLWNGVPSIVFDGPYSGGKEYLRGHTTHFRTYPQLKARIKEMYECPPVVDIPTVRNFIEKEYSYSRMATRLAEVLK